MLAQSASAQTNLTKNALTGEQLGAKTNHEAQHGESAIPGLSESNKSKAGIGGVHGVFPNIAEIVTACEAFGRSAAAARGSRFLISAVRLSLNFFISMSTTVLLELFAGFSAAFVALWMLVLSRPGGIFTPRQADTTSISLTNNHLPSFLRLFISDYYLSRGFAASTGLLILRLAIGVMMIHHGQEKLANPQSFADAYVTPLHLPFPLLMAYAAGYAEILGSWMLIFGLLAPLGALALTGTMAVAAYHHILTSGLNIYLLELVVLYLGGSLALLLVGPGRYSFDAGIAQGIASTKQQAASESIQIGDDSDSSAIALGLGAS